MASTFALERELRDPTREELFTGPTRELPAEIQQMPVEDTACTFCGVSYFVFAEVQELQATVKKYKTTFREFVRFLERERKVSQDLKTETLALKKSFEHLASTLAAHATDVAAENAALRCASAESNSKLLASQRDVMQQQELNQQLQFQMKRAEDERRIASALTEQKLRNEVLHLSSQIEKCRLQSSTQEAEVAAELDHERAKMRALEAQYAEMQASWSATERQVVSERDEMKQKVLGLTERVGEERNVAKQLEVQLRAVQQELARVTAASEAERAAFSQLTSDVILLKHQLAGLEKSRALLLAERAQLQDDKTKSDELVPQLRLQVATLQQKIDVNVAATERIKHEYTKELEKLRLEHANDLSRLQREHAKALDDLRTTQKAYVEFLQRETSEMKQSVESTKHSTLELQQQLHDTERQVAHWKDQAARSTEDLQRARAQASSLTAALEKKVAALESEKRESADETHSLQRTLETQQTKAKQQLESALRDSAERERRLDAQNTTLQQRVSALEAKLKQLERDRAQAAMQATAAAAPQLAWSDKSDHASGTKAPKQATRGNQESHDLERVIEKLRQSLSQKDSEIALLQQTVHRECLERTSLLEKMRSGKVLPDIVASPSTATSPLSRTSAAALRTSTQASSGGGASTSDDDDSRREPAEHASAGQPKASFYEKLRKAGQRKSKPRK